ncbi:hypothetical protein AYO44_17165 [Planctomycetaceae bacterium SCGC AG-212-F19]|nr:hypothetical protein AYO44_17165 [Planctomycetaceae bacterium SCGC AG-212-F19]
MSDLPGTDRRTLARYPCQLEAVCDRIIGVTPFSYRAVIEELSTQGIALRVTDRFDPGTVLTVRCATATDKVTFTKLCRVVHIQPERAGGWLMGVALLQPLRTEEVRWLLAPEIQDTTPLYFDI